MANGIDFLKIAERLSLLFSSYSVMSILNDDTLKNEMLGYYRLIYDDNLCSTCRNTLYPQFLKLKNNYEHKIAEKMAENAKKYKLKVGEEFRFFGEGTIYTNANLTDEIAELYLSKYPKQIVKFEETESVEPKLETQKEETESVEVIKESKKGKK